MSSSSRIRSAASLAVLAAAVTACDIGSTSQPTPIAGVRVVNATSSAVDVYIDSVFAVSSLGAGTVSPALVVNSGNHTVQLTAPGVRSVISNAAVPLDPNELRTAVARAGAGTTVQLDVLSDTGAVVPEGKTKLRVANYSTQDIRIYRKQPDFADSVSIQTPFPSGTTSPYLQSDPGQWEVIVVNAAGTRLTSTGAIAQGPGERRTVVVLDSAGVVRTRVLPE